MTSTVPTPKNFYFLLDKQKKVIPCNDRVAWARWIENPKNRIIARDQVRGMCVSTAFLGVDHGLGSKPRFFETMILGGPLDGQSWRYHTHKEARMGHAKVVEEVKGMEVYFGLDENNQPVELSSVHEWLENRREIIQGEREIVQVSSKGGVSVKTAFNGITDNGEPYLWETLLTKLDDVEAWKLVGRYTSLKAARKGHKEVLEKIEKATTENKDPFEILPDLEPWDE